MHPVKYKIACFWITITLFVVIFVSSCTITKEPNKSFSDFICDDHFPAFNQELIFAIDQDTVSGYAFIANDSTSKETVILVKGYPGNDSNFDLAQSLRRNNYNVILFNHRGAWGSQGQYMYSNCLEDIDGVVTYLSQPEIANKLRIDTNRFVLIGRSLGGGVSLIQGSKNNAVKKIIALSSVNYGIVMEKYSDLSELTGFIRYMKKQVMIETNIDLFLQEMLDRKIDFNVLTHVEALKNKRVLCIENSDKNDDWINQLPNAEVYKIPSGHNFVDKRIEMINFIVNWLDKN